MYDLKRENVIMQQHTEGDQVRIDIPDKSDPDFELYHGEQGEIVEVIEDDAGKATRDKRDVCYTGCASMMVKRSTSAGEICVHPVQSLIRLRRFTLETPYQNSVPHETLPVTFIYSVFLP